MTQLIITTLGESCDMYQPKTISKKEMIEDGKYPVFGANGIIGRYNQYNHEERELLLTCRGATCGALNVSEPYSWINGNAMVIKPKIKDINFNYLRYFLEGGIDLKHAITGAAQPQITRQNLIPITLPVPPLPVQKQIVEKLDAAFADIDKAISATETNIENAQSILESHINEKMKCNDDTEVIELGTVIDTLTDYHANGSYKILKKHVALKDGEDYAWMVRSTDFENNFQNDKKYITKSAYDFLKKSKIFGGELLMSKIGNAGKIYLMPQLNKPASLAMNMFLIRCDESTTLNEYIFFYLSSYFGNQQINDRLKGAATLTITKDSVRSIKIPLISIEKQRNIISEITAIRKKAGSVEEIYRMKFKNLSALKLSILNQAFSGELTKDAA